MFQWYKNKKKLKHEAKIRECIEYNKNAIKAYQQRDDILYDVIGSWFCGEPISKLYMDGQWNKLQCYNVDENLYNEMISTHDNAINELDKAYEYLRTINGHKRNRQQIKIYKEAIKESILELKNEGKI